MLDALVVLVPDVAAVHADGEVKLKVEPPLLRLVKRPVVERATRRGADQDALLVQAIERGTRARHGLGALRTDGAVDVRDERGDLFYHDIPPMLAIRIQPW